MDALKSLPWQDAYGQKHVMLAPATRGEFNKLIGDISNAGSALNGNPEDPGYLVKYVDANDYISWTPAAAAIGSYKLNGALSCGHAMIAMMEGKVAVRRKWIEEAHREACDVAEPVYKWVAGGSIDMPPLQADKFWNEHSKAQAVKNGGYLAVASYFVHFDGASIVMGWLPSHEDARATDWCVFDSIELPHDVVTRMLEGRPNFHRVNF